MNVGSFTEKQRKPTAAERRKVRDWVRKWQAEFYLHIVTIHLFFHDTPKDDDESDTFGAAASIDARLSDHYHEATLHIYPRFFVDNDDEDQEFMVCHELVHIITDILSALITRQRNGEIVSREEQRRADERVTNWVAKIAFIGGSAPLADRPMKAGAIAARMRRQ